MEKKKKCNKTRIEKREEFNGGKRNCQKKKRCTQCSGLVRYWAATLVVGRRGATGVSLDFNGPQFREALP